LNAAKWAAVFGMLGCACGMIQNELVLQEADPTEFRMDLCKGLNSIFTLICLLIIYRYYWMRAVIFRINRHCRRLVRFDANISFGHIASSWGFWLEVIVVGGHCPPFYTTEYWTNSFDNVYIALKHWRRSSTHFESTYFFDGSAGWLHSRGAGGTMLLTEGFLGWVKPKVL
jgi:hypothetical protein